MPILLVALVLIAFLAWMTVSTAVGPLVKLAESLNGPLGYGVGAGLAVCLILYGLKRQSKTTGVASTDERDSADGTGAP